MFFFSSTPRFALSSVFHLCSLVSRCLVICMIIEMPLVYKYAIIATFSSGRAPHGTSYGLTPFP